MPYTEQLPHAGSAEVMFNGLFDEPAGTLARTIPRASVNVATGAFSGGTGVPNVRALPLPTGLPVTNLAWLSGSTAEVTGTHAWAALMDVNSNVLAVTADQTGGTYVATASFLKNPVTNPILVPQTGLYYFVVGVSAATMPTMAGAGNSSSGLNAQTPFLYGVLAAQAAPPAVGQNLGAITGGGNGANFAAWIS